MVLKNGNEKVTSNYGNRTYTLQGKRISDFHTGIDCINSNTGIDNIVAIQDGTVVAIRTNITGFLSGSYGNYVKIKHGNGFETLYCHMKYGSINVKVGDKIKKGQVIGYMGSTGHSTGAHLHFEVRVNGKAINPTDIFYGKTIIPIKSQSTSLGYVKGNYKTLYSMKVRDGVWGNWKNKNQLSADGQRNCVSGTKGTYKAGTIFTALEIISHSDGSVWSRGYSGYVCLKDKNQEYCKKC